MRGDSIMWRWQGPKMTLHKFVVIGKHCCLIYTTALRRSWVLMALRGDKGLLQTLSQQATAPFISYQIPLVISKVCPSSTMFLTPVFAIKQPHWHAMPWFINTVFEVSLKQSAKPKLKQTNHLLVMFQGHLFSVYLCYSQVFVLLFQDLKK